MDLQNITESSSGSILYNPDFIAIIGKQKEAYIIDFFFKSISRRSYLFLGRYRLAGTPLHAGLDGQKLSCQQYL